MEDVQKVDLSADVGELETVSEQIREQDGAESRASSVVDETIPEKYRGMSVKDLAEKLEVQGKDLGRYTNELGEVRRLADELIRSSLHKPREQEVSNEEVDIFSDPQEVMRRAIESNPTVQQTAQYALQAQKALTQQRLYQLHPDADEMLSDQAFAEFVNKTPARQRMFNAAHNNYDLEAAHELFSTFKEVRAVKKSDISESEKSARDSSMKAAGVDTGGSGESSKTIYNREKVLTLMTEAYKGSPKAKKELERIKSDLSLAYKEKRVR